MMVLSGEVTNVLDSALQHYLRATESINCNHPSLWLRAARLTANCSGSVEKARALFNFVRDEIRFSPVIAYPASAILDRREGICAAKALLFAALCRAVGIPTGFAFQGIRGARTADKLMMHCLCACYLNDQWVRLDPRGGTRYVVPFDSVRGTLLPEQDFYIAQYPGIYDDLPEEFVHALKQENWQDAWPESILRPPTDYISWQEL
jgi:transglutaminase-like putative cysteine protease